MTSAKEAFTSRVQGEIAELAFDSLLDETGTAEDHTLTFEHHETTVEIRVTSCNDFFRLRGRLYGAQPQTVVLHAHDLDTSYTSEPDDGMFHFDHVVHGHLRIELDYGGEPVRIWTDWFLL